MKRTLCLMAMLFAVALWLQQPRSSNVMAAGAEKTGFTPGEIQWGPAPPVLQPGAQMAVLEGDPSAASGDFTVRMKMPDGYKIAPHWHPRRENVTVISGILKVGMGDQFDESKMATYPAGSFAYVDPQMHHYAMVSGETVVQIHGMSPLQVNYVNPDDDPSKKKE